MRSLMDYVSQGVPVNIKKMSRMKTKDSKEKNGT